MSSVTFHVHVSLQRTQNDTAMGRHRNQKAHEAEMETYPYASRIHRELRATPPPITLNNGIKSLFCTSGHLLHTLFGPQTKGEKKKGFLLWTP